MNLTENTHKRLKYSIICLITSTIATIFLFLLGSTNSPYINQINIFKLLGAILFIVTFVVIFKLKSNKDNYKKIIRLFKINQCIIYGIICIFSIILYKFSFSSNEFVYMEMSLYNNYKIIPILIIVINFIFLFILIFLYCIKDRKKEIIFSILIYGTIFLYVITLSSYKYNLRYLFHLYKFVFSSIIIIFTIISIIFANKALSPATTTELELYKKYEPINKINNLANNKIQTTGSLNDENNITYGDSYFDGYLIQLIGWNILASLVNILTIYILYPVTICWKLKWKYKHTVYDGKRLVFDGNGVQLLGNWILWMLLSVITLGIYLFFIPIRIEKWKAKHTHLIDDYNQ